MSSGFGDLTQRANQLVAAGDLVGAQELLGVALASADPSPGSATPELADAAGLQARVLVALGEPHSARGWAAYAHSAATQLYGPTDQRTVATAATFAAVLHRIGDHTRSAQLYRDVIIELTATDGPESLRVLAAHADLATVEYAQGDCEVARTRLQEAWELHREVYGDGHLSGIKMLARLGAMQRDCGHFTEGHGHLALARELCREHLPPDHPLATQIAALARAAANPDHVCPPDVPDDPPVWTTGTSPAADQPVAPPPAPPTGPPQESTAHRIPPPRDPVEQPRPSPRPTAPPDDPATAGEREGWSGSEAGYRRPEWAGCRRPNAMGLARETGPDPDPPGWSRETGPGGDAVRDRPVGRAEPPLPPAVPALASPARIPRELPPGTNDGPGGGPRGRNLPVRRHTALPVRLHPPNHRTDRRTAPVLLAGLAVVLLGAGAVITGFALVDDSEPDPPGRTGAAPIDSAGEPASPTPPTEAAPGSPPTDIRLRDGLERITLDWNYPRGADGPVVVSGGRDGQEPRAFEELPAGTTRYVVYGLDTDTDYCFSVAVVYSTDVVGRAEPVCTNRAAASPER